MGIQFYLESRVSLISRRPSLLSFWTTDSIIMCILSMHKTCPTSLSSMHRKVFLCKMQNMDLHENWSCLGRIIGRTIRGFCVIQIMAVTDVQMYYSLVSWLQAMPSRCSPNVFNLLMNTLDPSSVLPNSFFFYFDAIYVRCIRIFAL